MQAEQLGFNAYNCGNRNFITPQTMIRQTIQTDYLQTIDWLGESIVDWVYQPANSIFQMGANNSLGNIILPMTLMAPLHLRTAAMLLSTGGWKQKVCC
jgi:hypothetical protein